MIDAFIFDLDGVITDTAEYHYLAWKELANKIDRMQQEWRKMNRNLAFYIEHDELEKVNTSLTLMKGYLEMEDYSQGVPELENCIYILYHIQDKQSLKIINLF